MDAPATREENCERGGIVGAAPRNSDIKGQTLAFVGKVNECICCRYLDRMLAAVSLALTSYPLGLAAHLTGALSMCLSDLLRNHAAFLCRTH
jgi:hypothetical protein